MSAADVVPFPKKGHLISNKMPSRMNTHLSRVS